ncbi:hypothetical protein ESZ50_07595 [Weissella muntiaci]|uniref:YdhG-like domain-containing protein n=1 Tax=Weissella muntiaci TaxID=2508881 RepID=A0A6C2C522_9LACO|nr:DUF1801 domain-containing protein [Weissella muntiaci]TYC49101.1 hypothetical protein ESZ50_07595 [Weissella muntiaci]
MTIITDFIDQAPMEQQPYLNKMYRLSKQLLPTADEKISYGMPTFFEHGNLIHFAGMKKHLGFYPTPDVITHFRDELVSYKTSKGAIQFPYERPLPVELIQQMITYRSEHR